jgi:16S rRNA A1518/A1519 N6-dimethyltransferase RsmA/KsgA/DIM1 with predicted DNA glycosylase/AP lyase activity
VKCFLDNVNELHLKLNSLDLIKKNNNCYLFTHRELRMTYNCETQEQVKEFLLEEKLSYGKCILSGLGMGILTNILLKKKTVKEVIVYEINEDVIKLYQILNPKNLKLKIINEDIHNVSKEECDCLFLDHYEKEDFSYILRSIKKINNNIKSKVFWFWNVKNIIFKNENRNLIENYRNFIKKISLSNMPNLDEKSLKNYVFEA